jgi:predicted flap endonuclease-1-like 5' DNA nuclease
MRPSRVSVGSSCEVVTGSGSVVVSVWAVLSDCCDPQPASTKRATNSAVFMRDQASRFFPARVLAETAADLLRCAAVSSEPPTKEYNIKDEEEQTDPHLRLPTASSPPEASKAAPTPSTGPKPMSAMPKRTLGATGSIPTVMTGREVRSRIATPLPPAPIPSASPPPLRSSQLSRPSVEPARPAAETVAARPPILPSATRFGPTPSAPPPPMQAAPSVVSAPAAPAAAPAPTLAAVATERISSFPNEPASGPILATMLIPRPSSLPPALNRPADPNGDPLRERLALVEVQSAASRSIAQRIESQANRAHTRLDALEPRVASNEANLKEALTRIEQAHEATRQSLELRVTQVELVARPGAPPAQPAAPTPSAAAAEATELAAPLRTALATIRQELAEHERKFEARRARIESLESRLGILEVDARLIELRRMTEGFDLRIARIERDHANAQADLDGKVRGLIGEMEERIAARVLAAAEERAAQDRAAAEAAKQEPAKKEPAPKKAESELKKIKGVSPKYQKALTELGITTVAAVAALADDDLARIAARLSMSVEKVKKLGWVETARALAPE